MLNKNINIIKKFIIKTSILPLDNNFNYSHKKQLISINLVVINSLIMLYLMPQHVLSNYKDVKILDANVLLATISVWIAIIHINVIVINYNCIYIINIYNNLFIIINKYNKINLVNDKMVKLIKYLLIKFLIYILYIHFLFFIDMFEENYSYVSILVIPFDCFAFVNYYLSIELFIILINLQSIILGTFRLIFDLNDFNNIKLIFINVDELMEINYKIDLLFTQIIYLFTVVGFLYIFNNLNLRLARIFYLFKYFNCRDFKLLSQIWLRNNVISFVWLIAFVALVIYAFLVPASFVHKVNYIFY